MHAKDVRVFGIFLLLSGLIVGVYAFNVPSTVVTGYSKTFSVYPMSVKTPEEKISPELKSKLAETTGEVPVVVVLTAPAGSMAIAQQQAVMQTFQMAGFKMSLNIVNVANAVAGTVPATNIKTLASSPYIDKILYDGKFFKLTATPDIKLLSQSVPQIGADRVWAQGYTGQGVTVIIIDSGVQNNHPWLMRDGKSLVLKEYDIVPGSHDYTASHGTHCAGIIASQNSKYRGVAPGIKGFVDIIAFDSQGSAQLSWILEALDRAYQVAQNSGPVVCTNSWGAIADNTPELNSVRDAAMKLADVCPTVFAAGNFGPSSNTIACPADADKNGNEVITVGAVDKSGNVAWFSSRGPDNWGADHNEPDITAPGVQIMSSVPGGSEEMSGTSMATPHVAGVIALMLSKNPALTNKECLDILTRTAADRGTPGFDYQYGYGIVQADRAVEATPGGGAVVVTSSLTSPVLSQAMSATLITAGAVLYIDPELVTRR